MEIIKESKFDSFDSENSVGIVETKYFYFGEPPEEMLLESGSKLGPVTLAYETYGILNTSRSNAILIFHALSGDAHAAGFNSKYDRKPGWWDSMIGPGKPFNTLEYYIICANIIGGCKGSTGPASINYATGNPYGLNFPVISIKDIIAAQKKLLKYLGIEMLFCVVGGSMGGMMALQWIVSYPEISKGAMLIATAPSHSAQEIAFNSIGRYAITTDPNWNCGDYYNGSRPEIGLSIARMIGHVTYISEGAIHKKFGRSIKDESGIKDRFGGEENPGKKDGRDNAAPKNSDDENKNIKCPGLADFTNEFEVGSYLKYQGEAFIKRFDANSYLYITKAIDDFDISTGFANLADALAKVKAKCFVISFSTDWLYPAEQSLKIVKALKINGIETTYTNFDSPFGHDAFLIEDERLKKIFSGFLKSLQM
jgi:homoserine O-acetyltransferase/O-succinyltransferase